MSARETLHSDLLTTPTAANLPHPEGWASARIQRYRDEVRAETLAEAKAEVIAWLVKKAHEDTPVTRLADKVNRGAIRLFLEAEEKASAPAPTATPTCTCTIAEEFTPTYNCVCREDPNAGPAHTGHERWCPARKPTPERIAEIRQGIGDELTHDELNWLNGAAGRHELHVTGARGGHWPLRDLPGAVLLLAQYLAATVAVIERSLPDEAEEKASADIAPTATPQPGPVPQWTDEERQQRLLIELHTRTGQWRTGRVEHLYQTWDVHYPRSRARKDLKALHTAGHLTQHGPADGRFYLPNTRKDGQR